MKILKNSKILITGGTGSFGKAVVNKFLNFEIKELKRTKIKLNVKNGLKSFRMNSAKRLRISRETLVQRQSSNLTNGKKGNLESLMET